MARKNHKAPHPPSQEELDMAEALRREAMAFIGEPPADVQGVGTMLQADEPAAVAPAAEAGTAAGPSPAVATTSPATEPVRVSAVEAQRTAVSPPEEEEDRSAAPAPLTVPTSRWGAAVRRGFSTTAAEGISAANPAPVEVQKKEAVEHQPDPRPAGGSSGGPMPTPIKTKAGNITWDAAGNPDTRKVDKKIRRYKKEAAKTKLLSWTGAAVITGTALVSGVIGMNIGFAAGEEAGRKASDITDENVTKLRSTGTK